MRERFSPAKEAKIRIVSTMMSTMDRDWTDHGYTEKQAESVENAIRKICDRLEKEAMKGPNDKLRGSEAVPLECEVRHD